MEPAALNRNDLDKLRKTREERLTVPVDLVGHMDELRNQ